MCSKQNIPPTSQIEIHRSFMTSVCIVKRFLCIRWSPSKENLIHLTKLSTGFLITPSQESQCDDSNSILWNKETFLRSKKIALSYKLTFYPNEDMQILLRSKHYVPSYLILVIKLPNDVCTRYWQLYTHLSFLQMICFGEVICSYYVLYHLQLHHSEWEYRILVPQI